MSGDECVAWAMELVAEEKLEAASTAMLMCVARNPERTDVRIYFARTLAWQENFKQAIEMLEFVYKTEPENIEAITLESDIHLWSQKLKKSLNTVNRGLQIDPENEGLLFRKARLANDLQMKKSAWNNLERLLRINPDHEGAKKLRSSMRDAKKPVVAGLNFISEQYSEYYKSRFTCNAYLRVPTRRVVFIPNINLTEIDGRQGAQIELSAYPRLGKFGYAYLNAGFSKSLYYPRFKYGAEFFKDFEEVSVSAGFRHNYVNDDIKNTIYVASIAQSIRKMRLTYRLFILPLENEVSLSHVVDAKLITKRLNQLRLFVGIGNYTELKPNLFQDELSYWEPRTFQTFGFDYNHNIDMFTLRAGYMFTRQQFHLVPYPFFRKSTFTLGFEVRF